MGGYASILAALLLSSALASERNLREEIDVLRDRVVQLQMNQLKLHSLAIEPKCPYPFTKVIDECFFVSRKALSWDSARRHCLGMGGDLATPAHLYALTSFIMLSEGPIRYTDSLMTWVGGERREDGSYWWLSNSTLRQEDWLGMQGEYYVPVERTFRCLYIVNTARTDGGIVVDQSCDTKMQFVCQIPLQ